MSSKKIILVVEDNESFQYVLKMSLEHADFEVIQAMDLQGGRDAFDRHGNELAGIIMDHKLGHEYSISLVKKIREIGFTNPIIAFSGDMGGQQDLIAAGCSHRIDGKGTDGNLVQSVKRIIG